MGLKQSSYVIGWLMSNFGKLAIVLYINNLGYLLFPFAYFINRYINFNN